MANTSISVANSKFLKSNIAKWDTADDCIAPLTERQRDSVLDLTTVVNTRIIPEHLKDEDSEFSGVKVPESGRVQKTELLDMFCTIPITNTQQFYGWFCDVQSEMERDEEQHLSHFAHQLTSFKCDCDDLLSEVESSMDQLHDLQTQYEMVSTKTSTLHQSCEHLLEEQTSLMNIAESIQSKLSYFNELDRINTKLGGQSLTVTSEGFIPMLTRLDECMSYMQSNPRYKDSSVYLAKFQHTLSRALSMIRTHVSNLLSSTTSSIQSTKRPAVNPEDTFTLYYGKFRTNSPRVKSLIQQIERRVDKNESYRQLLADCHQCYVSQREVLVEPSVSIAVQELNLKHKTDHCALMRSGCALLVHICQDESQLYQYFFGQPSQMLDEFLERLCNYLYDAFRPLIIHINHMETLAELCTILKVEMLEDHVYNNPQPLQSFEKVVLQMLQDVQERLVYRTYIYINSDILNYKPGTGDLAYPDKLQMMQNIAESMKVGGKSLRSQSSMNSSTQSLEGQEVAAIVGGEIVSGDQVKGAATLPVSVNSSMPLSPADLHGMWYPTVRKTLVCLSKLSRCIDTTTFQGLSQEALNLCIQSLLLAKRLISKNKTQMDSQLFYIKHLLIIREQISPFQASFSVKETQIGFSHIKDAALGLVKRSSDLFKFNSNNSLLQFLVEGTPQATECLMDSKQDVDQQLKVSCAEFIDHVTSQLLSKLQDFLARADVILKMADQGSTTQFKSQPFAQAEAVRECLAESYRVLKSRVPSLHQTMSLYLSNRDTEAILFKPIKARVQKSYQQVIELLAAEYSEEERHIIACPTMEQVLLILSNK